MCYKEIDGEERRHRADVEDEVLIWMERRAKEHHTFGMWLDFLVKDFPAYTAFRTAVRTGDFKLRMAAFRRLAPLFCITGKDRYQSLAAHRLFDLAAMPDSDLRVLSEIFSVGVGDDPFARVWGWMSSRRCPIGG